MGQTTFARDVTKKRAGAFVDYQGLDTGDVVTGRNELSTKILPGLFVAQGASDEDVMIDDSGATGAVILGVAMDNENRERNQGNGITATGGYVQNALVPVAKSGRVYVNCGSVAAKNGQVYVRFVTGTTTVIGEAYNSADSAKCDLIPAKFAETITSAGIVAIDLNMHEVGAWHEPLTHTHA
jgi:hypothetical protein